MSTNIKNYKTFEQLESDIRTLNDLWKKEKPDSDKSKTFAGIQKTIQSLYFFISNERKALNEEIGKLKDVWSDKVVTEHRKDLISSFDNLVQTVIASEKKEIASLVSSKFEKIGDMISTAPTEDQLRLLSALQMRGDVDPVELTHILPMLFGNYQAMRVLQTISEQNGIHLYIPVQLDCRTMYDTLNEANDFLMGACEELSKEKLIKMNIAYHAFYTTNKEEADKQYDPKYQQYIDLFDTTPQLQDCKTEKRTLSPSEKARIDWYMRDIMTLDMSDKTNETTILKSVKDIMTNNPDMIDLLKLSDYKVYVSAIELSEKDEVDPE